MLRRFSILFALLAVAACTNPSPNHGDPVDINAVAENARGDIDTYAANALEQAAPAAAMPVSVPALMPSATPSVAVAVANVGSEAPFDADSAQGAADIVQTYYALLEERNYAAAYRLWERAGAASGLDANAYAASFAKYADYYAEVGTPGRVDAGAGQRYVEVPVRVYGTLKDHGRPFNMEGALILHRVADIDGASAAERRWHIRDSSIRPRPQQSSAGTTAPAPG